LPKIVLAFLFSLLLHILFLYFFNDSLKFDEPKINTSNKLEDIGSQNIKYVKIVQPKPKKIVKQEKNKNIDTKSNQKFKPLENQKKFIKVPKKIEPIKKKINKQALSRKDLINKKQLEQEKLYEKMKENDLKEIAKLDEKTKSYLKLYGEEYFKFSKETKKYLNNNLNNIGKVTQFYLKYPRIAIKTNQQGMNIVQFFLHPNGDISDLKLTNSSGYRTLDKNTIKTIKIAYKDYPRPKEKTKIKIYVYYQLR
jgi:protein TonB